MPPSPNASLGRMDDSHYPLSHIVVGEAWGEGAACADPKKLPLPLGFMGSVAVIHLKLPLHQGEDLR